MSNKKNFSYINTIEDLHAMQTVVKLRIKEREKDLVERMQKLPQETIKATVGAVVPAFLNNRVAGTTWSILKGSLGLLFRKKGASDSLKENVFSAAKKLGLFTALKAAYNLWSKK
jgi:hypothetical protein